jgi:hypothetical protein
MQVVNISKLSLLILIVLIIGCSKKIQNELVPNNNSGGYSFEFKNTKNGMSDSLLITGGFFDLKTRQPLGGSSVHFYCQKIMTDSIGNFNFKLSSGLKSDYFFRGVSIGYKTVITDFISLKSDTLKLNFYLDEDTTPIYHCED